MATADEAVYRCLGSLPRQTLELLVPVEDTAHFTLQIMSDLNPPHGVTLPYCNERYHYDKTPVAEEAGPPIVPALPALNILPASIPSGRALYHALKGAQTAARAALEDEARARRAGHDPDGGAHGGLVDALREAGGLQAASPGAAAKPRTVDYARAQEIMRDARAHGIDAPAAPELWPSGDTLAVALKATGRALPLGDARYRPSYPGSKILALRDVSVGHGDGTRKVCGPEPSRAELVKAGAVKRLALSAASDGLRPPAALAAPPGSANRLVTEAARVSLEEAIEVAIGRLAPTCSDDLVERMLTQLEDKLAAASRDAVYTTCYTRAREQIEAMVDNAILLGADASSDDDDDDAPVATPVGGSRKRKAGSSARKSKRKKAAAPPPTAGAPAPSPAATTPQMQLPPQQQPAQVPQQPAPPQYVQAPPPQHMQQYHPQQLQYYMPPQYAQAGQQAPQAAQPAAAPTAAPPDTRPPCRNFINTGRCAYGTACKFKHGQ